jgi:hypothetical protein
MTGPREALPVILAAAGPGQGRLTRRVGRFVGAAHDLRSFEQLFQRIRAASVASLTNPTRLLGVSHLVNAVTKRLDGIAEESTPLVEGFIFELLSRGELSRLISSTQAREFHPVVLTPADEAIVELGFQSLRDKLSAEGSLTRAQAQQLLPARLQAWDRNVDVLLGALLAQGIATTNDALGTQLRSVRMPHA